VRLRPLTKLEEKMMGVARQRQLDNIVQKQVVWGREFKVLSVACCSHRVDVLTGAQGEAFLASPSKIEFRDFEVGQTYTLKARRLVVVRLVR
jgi:hypothetical protein